MRRVVIAISTLVIAGSALLGDAASVGAVPPPCPRGDTFVFCEHACPASPSSYCLSFLGYPPDCQATAQCLFTTMPCDGAQPENPLGKYTQVNCTYQ